MVELTEFVVLAVIEVGLVEYLLFIILAAGVEPNLFVGVVGVAKLAVVQNELTKFAVELLAVMRF